MNDQAGRRHLKGRNCIGQVCEIDGEIVGYMVYLLSVREIGLVNLTVSPEWRGEGHGRAMIHLLQDKIATHRTRKAITLDVSEQWLGAHLFLKQCGFRASAVFDCATIGDTVYHFKYQANEQTPVAT